MAELSDANYFLEINTNMLSFHDKVCMCGCLAVYIIVSIGLVFEFKLIKAQEKDFFQAKKKN